jgi:hypothetical protein
MVGIGHQISGHRHALFIDQHSAIRMSDLKAGLASFTEIGFYILSKSGADQFVNRIFVPRQKLPASMVCTKRFRVGFQNFRRVIAGVDRERHELKIRIRFGHSPMQIGHIPSNHRAGFNTTRKDEAGQPTLAQQTFSAYHPTHTFRKFKFR